MLTGQRFSTGESHIAALMITVRVIVCGNGSAGA
jgi:hypothetical protein